MSTRHPRTWSPTEKKKKKNILGTNCDQCRSMVQCCFTSTETVNLSLHCRPGRPPRQLADRFFVLFVVVLCSNGKKFVTDNWNYDDDVGLNVLKCGADTPETRNCIRRFIYSIVSAPSSCLFTTFFLLFGARVPPVKRGLECGSRRFESAGHCEWDDQTHKPCAAVSAAARSLQGP